MEWLGGIVRHQFLLLDPLAIDALEDIDRAGTTRLFIIVRCGGYKCVINQGHLEAEEVVGIRVGCHELGCLVPRSL